MFVGRYKSLGLRHASHRPECGAGASFGSLGEGGPRGRPTHYFQMLAVDDSDFTPEYRVFLQEWAEALNVSVEVLLARIVVATIDGFLYTEKIPDYQIDDGLVR